ncbi:unnamed protein product [Trichogramma brassicae]|uniref:Uncharacterized protein n=1 Tax=Trichogramma brassicae TaxID=86971 RepID=A0A6H5IG30_9HYME|nr:unnamed protein product [Trichogramma brassicae]
MFEDCLYSARGPDLQEEEDQKEEPDPIYYYKIIKYKSQLKKRKKLDPKSKRIVKRSSCQLDQKLFNENVARFILDNMLAFRLVESVTLRKIFDDEDDENELLLLSDGNDGNDNDDSNSVDSDDDDESAIMCQDEGLDVSSLLSRHFRCASHTLNLIATTDTYKLIKNNKLDQRSSHCPRRPQSTRLRASLAFSPSRNSMPSLLKLLPFLIRVLRRHLAHSRSSGRRPVQTCSESVDAALRTRVALPSSHTLTLHRGYYSNTYTFRPGTYNISPRRRELIYAVFIYLADTHESLSLTVIHPRYTAATTITRIHSVPGPIIEARADTTHIRRALIHSRRIQVTFSNSHTLTLHRGYYNNTYTFRPGTYNISPRRRELIYAVFIYLADTHESLSLTVIHPRYTAATTITRIHSVPGLQ